MQMGTKIQATLFNNHVQTWKKLFEPNQAYYIQNGRATIPKADFASVNSELQIAFNNYTTVTECKSEFLYQHFSDGFVPFDKAEKFTDRAQFDVVGILIKVKPLIVEGSSKRREVILTDERHVTLLCDCAWSVKSDVYAFGVLLLNLMGKRVTDKKNVKETLVGRLALKDYQPGRSLVDTSLQNDPNFDSRDGPIMTDLARQCVEDKQVNRPLMKEVVKRLEALHVVQQYGEACREETSCFQRR